MDIIGEDMTPGERICTERRWSYYRRDISHLVGFARDHAAGLAVAGGLGFVAEKVASQVPISLSPLLYATAFGIAIGNALRLIDPAMTTMAPTAVGMSFAKRRLLRAGIILYGAKVHSLTGSLAN